MSDDIVERLRESAEECWYGSGIKLASIGPRQ